MMNLKKNISMVFLSCHLFANCYWSNAFVTTIGPTRRVSSCMFSTKDDAVQQAKELLERAQRMRAEIADLEGKDVKDVEKEAMMKKEVAMKAAAEREEMASKRLAAKATTTRQSSAAILTVPENAEDQVRQATSAVERAFKDGKTRQIVRFALIPEGEVLNEDRQWPGGAQQMYREAANPLTSNLLNQVRAPTTGDFDPAKLSYSPNITAQDIWDFDGSALITAKAASGPSDDVQALVLPNTDTKYTNDIKEIDHAMGDRLFFLVNPFWRDLESWGLNILAPNGKKLAKEAIFDRGFEETYVLLQKSVRGEDCIALKAYPYDWQLYAYIETDYWPYQEYITHLGSTKDEPTAKDFADLLEKRDEFKMNKNMRRMDRMMNRNQ